LTLIDGLGPYVAQAVAETSRKPDARGWVRCTIPIESTEYGVLELMRLGADVEVVGPPALRARMQQSLRETLEQYAPRRAGRRHSASR
jgi:predicted DNA-binding transcriptional regulator YafY